MTYEERCHIYAYKHSEKSNREIALLIGCFHTAINEEIKRNTGKRGYRNNQADKLAQNRRAQASSAPKMMTLRALTLIQNSLKENQASPEQISGSLSLRHGLDISHEAIYKYLEGQKNGSELYAHLRHKAKKYNKRSGKNDLRGLIPNRRDIREKPVVVENKTRLGDLELDKIVGARFCY